MPPYWKPASIREPDGRVYHYGSARTLLGVVEDGVLWASEAAGLNDVAEIRGGWDLIESWLGAQPCAEAFWHVDDEWEWNEGFDWNGQAVLLLRTLIPGAELASQERRQVVARTATHTFVLCASTRGDDANQWRLYGGEGRGYAIGPFTPENHLHFRESPVGIVRYYQLAGVQDRTWGVVWHQKKESRNLGRLTAGKPPVADVCLGPLLPASNEEAVRALLKRHGLPDEVRHSQVPLR